MEAVKTKSSAVAPSSDPTIEAARATAAADRPMAPAPLKAEVQRTITPPAKAEMPRTITPPARAETRRSITPPEFPGLMGPSPASAEVPTARLEAASMGATAPQGGVQEFHARVAPLWRRALALTVDGLAIGGVAALYLWIASAITGASAHASRLSGIDKWVARAHALQPALLPGLILAVVIALAYAAAFAVLLNGRTFGRLMAGIRLVDARGLPPSPARAVIRALLSGVSFALFLGGFWLALFDRRGQTLHDKLTSTFLVRPV